MATPIITYRGTVYPSHCDHMGHMNVMWYVGKFDEGTWNLLSTVGFTREYMRDHNAATAGLEQNIKYHKELMPGDTISVRTTLLEVRDRVIRAQHEMVKNETGEVAAVMTLVIAHLDRATRRATAFPSAIKEKFLELRGAAS